MYKKKFSKINKALDLKTKKFNYNLSRESSKIKIWLISILLVALSGCQSIKPNYRIDQIQTDADYGVESYLVKLTDKTDKIGSMRIHFPTAQKDKIIAYTDKKQSDKKDQLAPIALNKAPVVIVFHGFLANKERIGWIGDLLASKGYIVAISTISYNLNPFQNPRKWIGGFQSAVEAVKIENLRNTSPVFEKADLNNVTLIGHSMGGGGVVHFSETDYEKVHNIKVSSVISLAPFEFLCKKPGAKAHAPTFVFTGSKDYMVNAAMSKEFYDELPKDLPRAQISLKEARHLDFERWNKYHNLIGVYILDWADIFAKGKDRNQTIFATKEKKPAEYRRLIEGF